MNDNKQLLKWIRGIVDNSFNKYIEQYSNHPTDITSLRLKVEQIQIELENLRGIKKDIVITDNDAEFSVTLLLDLKALITIYDGCRLRFQKDYEQRQLELDTLRAARIYLENIYKLIYEEIDNLISSGLIEQRNNKYNWKGDLKLLANLLMIKGGSFDNKISDYFLVKGKKLNTDSLHTLFKKKEISKDFYKLKEIFEDIEMPC